MRLIGELRYLAIQVAGLILIAGAGTSYCSAAEQAEDPCPQARTLYLSEEFKGAAREYCHCIKQDPSQKGLYRARGLACMGLGEFREAQKDFESAGEPPGVVEEAQSAPITDDPNPEWLEALNCFHRGDYFLYTHKTKEALEQYRNALSIRSNFPECWDHLAGALEMDGQNSEAAKYHVQAVSWRPKESENWAHLAGLLATQGNMEASREAFTIALPLAASEDYRKSLIDSLNQVNTRIEMQGWGH